MANACKRERIITDAADHVFRLPKLAASDAAAGMQRVQPTQTRQKLERLRCEMAGLTGGPKDETEARCKRTKFFRLDDGDVYLERVGKQKDPVSPIPNDNVHMVPCVVTFVHAGCPVRQNFRDRCLPN